MRQFLFISNGILPLIAYAESKDAMRAYVRERLGLAADAALPRHAVVLIA